MVYRIFTTLLKWKLTRCLLQKAKYSKLFQKLVPMLREWYERDAIHQYPFISMLGFGSLSKFKTISDALKFKRALIITGPVLINTEVIKKVKTELDDNKIKYHIFDGTKSNPSIQVVQEIIEMYHKTNADALISVGGGSVHDAAKGAALTLSNNKSLKKLQGINVSKNVSIVPIIAINTTAGTGSGVTNVAVITDESKHFKMTLVDKNIQPHVNVDDSDLMTGLPPKPTTWVGVDTLVHAIEAELSIYGNVLSKVYARSAMMLVYHYLPIVYRNPKDKKAREKMAYAEFMAGVAFNSASLGFIHSLSHALSGLFNTPHGLANAIIMPYVLDYELKKKKITPQLANISDYMNMTSYSEDELGKAKETVKNIIAFLAELGIPKTLNEVQPKITKKQIKQMATKAMKDFCGISNPVQFSRKEVIHIYKNAISGKFDNI